MVNMLSNLCIRYSNSFSGNAEMEKAKLLDSQGLCQAFRKLCPSFLVCDWCKHELPSTLHSCNHLS